MFRGKTTFIVGAGASCELGLPSGDQLKAQILQLLIPGENAFGLSGETLIAAIQQRLGDNLYKRSATDAVMAAVSRIRRGLPLAISIDNFIHSHQQDEELVSLGKLAIAISILQAEAGSKLFRNPDINELVLGRGGAAVLDSKTDPVRATWYYPLAQLLMAGVERRDIARAFENTQFIIFNYDRLLEQFLLLAVQEYFDVDEQQAASALRQVEFIHPYGSLGPLPWQSEGAEGALALGGTHGVNYNRVAATLRTFTESVTGELGSRVRQAVAAANTMIFLGFGFLEQNVALLTPNTAPSASRILSTAYGVSGYDQEMIRSLLHAFAPNNNPTISVTPGTCRELFDQHRIGLGFV
jgi:hypothetical protein